MEGKRRRRGRPSPRGKELHHGPQRCESEQDVQDEETQGGEPQPTRPRTAATEVEERIEARGEHDPRNPRAKVPVAARKSHSTSGRRAGEAWRGAGEERARANEAEARAHPQEPASPSCSSSSAGPGGSNARRRFVGSVPRPRGREGDGVDQGNERMLELISLAFFFPSLFFPSRFFVFCFEEEKIARACARPLITTVAPLVAGTRTDPTKRDERCCPRPADECRA